MALLSRIPSEREYGVKRCVLEELDAESRCALRDRKRHRILSLTQPRQYVAARVGGADPSALARLRRDAWMDSIRGDLDGLRPGLLQHASRLRRYPSSVCTRDGAHPAGPRICRLCSRCALCGAAPFASRRCVRFRLALDDLGLCGVVRSERDGNVACLQPGCGALPDPGRFRFWTLDHHIPARPHSGRYCDGPAKEITNASGCCDRALRVERGLRRLADFARR